MITVSVAMTFLCASEALCACFSCHSEALCAEESFFNVTGFIFTFTEKGQIFYMVSKIAC